jgi:glycosyltransferase involved in cell wall biosynthesis
MEKKKIKIDIVSLGGSPTGVTEQSIYGIDGRVGVGGAELGILTLCRMWHDAGHEVTFYNEGSEAGSEFHHAHLRDFNKRQDRDIFIIFRSPLPNEMVQHAKGKKIWYSNDQFTTGDYAGFRHMVDEVVVISEFHNEHFKTMYNIHDAHIIDIPVRTWEYCDTPKIRNSCIFTSVPDRGLLQLAPIWDKIVEKVPDATLTITGDWSLWTNGDFTEYVRPYRMAFARKKNITYKSAVNRKELVEIQKSAEFHLYPCVYPELFCISVAESQVAGAIPITSTIGALATTNRFGYKKEGVPTSPEFINSFVETATTLMNMPDRFLIRDNAKTEFGSESILENWDKLFYE